jgi:hypothetical protein
MTSIFFIMRFLIIRFDIIFENSKIKFLIVDILSIINIIKHYFILLKK